jgi:alpha-galactosidase
MDSDAEIPRRNFLAASCAAYLARTTEAAQQLPNLHNRGLAFTVGGQPGQPPHLSSLRRSGSDFEWCQTGGPFHALLTLDESTTDWRIAGVRSGADHHEIRYEPTPGLHCVQRIRLLPDFPVLEFQAEFQNRGTSAAPGITGFGPLRLPLRSGLGPLQMHCVRRNQYALERIPVDPASGFELRGGAWNNPGHAALMVLEAIGSGEFLVLGVEWERGWQLRLASVNEPGEALLLDLELSGLRRDIPPNERIECPRVFVALANGSADAAFGLAHEYLKKHVFPQPLPNTPWIVYDIWGTEAEGVEEALWKEIEFAADLGVELFYVDAAWYKGSSKKGNGDWGCGLGNYEEDREKFPRSLARMSRRVHERGMKFGLWVGPNIVDSRLVPDTVPRKWLAQAQGEDRVLKIPSWEATCHHVCLGCRDYIEHLKSRLSQLVRDFRLDWLKWDNSGLPGQPALCDRGDHGHQTGDGSYAALLGQYEIFAYLHEQFPKLVLEQCGYGSRLDYGLARMIRSNWLSDASFPSQHVRDNAMVASYIYPSFYNAGWVIRDEEIEKTTDAFLLDSIFRSRMTGLFGLGTLHGMLRERVSLFPEAALQAARRNIPVYKKYRHLLQERTYHLFPPKGSPELWQAIEFAKPDGSETVVLCFRGRSTQASLRIPLRGLEARQSYEITSANGVPSRRISGAALLNEGLLVTLPESQMSDVLFVQGGPTD